MVDGLAQTLRTDSEQLFTTHFRDFTYDIGRLFGDTGARFVHIRFLSTWQLFSDPAGVQALTGSTPGQILEEAHGRFAQPLLCVAAALIGFSTLLSGGFSRFGVWRQIVLAIVLLLVVKSVEGIAADPVRRDPSMWPLLYTPPLVGFAISAVMLWQATRANRPGFLSSKFGVKGAA
jgi:lipopolysaccharide export system permease protein